jgi:cellulose synthase/poly-beta-1,6-N-acetylglucosamine synthase-like glycosyltransferase
LETIVASNYPAQQMEVIVVDDGGSGGAPLEQTVQFLRGLVEFRLLTTSGVGPAGARNVGANAASGEFLVFTDDDCRVQSDWIRMMSAAIGSGSGRIAVGGRTINGLTNNRWSAASQKIIDLVYAYYNADPTNPAFFTTNNLALRRDAFLEIGGFDERYRTAEDREFCRRWLANGNRLAYIPEAVVFHEHELTLWGFLKQHFGYGRGAFRYFRSAPRSGQRTTRGFYSSMPEHLATLFSLPEASSRQRAELLGELALWQAANIAGFSWEAALSGWKGLD